MKLKLREIDHVVLRVTDMERMVRFYADVLGAELVAYRPKFKMTHLRAGGSMIDLVAGEAGAKRDERTKNLETKVYELCKTSVPFVCADRCKFSRC